MAPHQPDKIFRCISRERRFVKVGIGRDEVLGRRMNIREVASPAAGNSNLLAGRFITLDYQNGPPSLSRLDRTHEARSARPDNHHVITHSRIIYLGNSGSGINSGTVGEGRGQGARTWGP